MIADWSTDALGPAFAGRPLIDQVNPIVVALPDGRQG